MPDNVDLIGDPVLENPTKARWFNTCTLTAAGARQGCADASEQPAFRIRPNNALDTTGARLEGVFVSDPLILDMSFFKTFRFSQRISFQTRVEAFNLTNAVQWPGPNTTVTATAFGTVAETQSNDPRFVQDRVQAALVTRSGSLFRPPGPGPATGPGPEAFGNVKRRLSG